MSPVVLLAAFFGTIAFSILYAVPSRLLFTCGLNGLAGWIVYSLMLNYFDDSVAIFISTVAIYIVARLFAVHQKSPEIAFLLSGIFPIVPGAGIYWTAYYLVAGNMDAASTAGSGALKACLAMVLGIAIVHELPQRLFSGRQKNRRK